ncbi:enoyl-CoA hydratase/isomerase family protein [Shimia sp. R9_2]|uniref:enoyl-CoA hydratase-related protein n=1 Tax=Shimia sp. R9_2 TaxID=2821112 RepID=UPI001ADA5657|nr:enoyl-CoA hydratase-related protein [Shimia sp. R9_2]MBO9397212.1 enoyl-CoA hydratase/isomerase family protein [Shimia sp. R9_2]
MTQLLDYRVEGGVAILSLSEPPSDARGAPVRQAVQEAVARALEDQMVGAIALIGAAGDFAGGSDYAEIGAPKNPLRLGDLCNMVEAAGKPVVIGLSGAVVGSGLEFALACHYRVAHHTAQFAMPDAALGVIPGAGATQRLPRLIGADAALKLLLAGAVLPANAPELEGAVDEVAEGDIEEATVLFALTCIAQFKPARPTREAFEQISDFAGHQKSIESWRKRLAAQGQDAGHAIVECVRVAPLLPFDVGLDFERDRFEELLNGKQRAALQHVALAERREVRLSELLEEAPREIKTLGVIVGRDRLGAELALAGLRSGFEVVMVAQVPAALDLAQKRLEAVLHRQTERGQVSGAQADAMRAALSTPQDLVALSAADMVIEAVGLGQEVSRQLVAQLDGIVDEGALIVVHDPAAPLETLASATENPEDLLSLYVPNLYLRTAGVEIGAGAQTGGAAMATCFDALSKMGFFPVTAKAQAGLVGQTLMGACIRAAEELLRLGADPYEIDRVMLSWGMARGPFQVADALGLNAPGLRIAGASLSASLYGNGREGRDMRKGWYLYSMEHPLGEADEAARDLLAVALAEDARPLPKTSTKEAEITRSCLAAMANAGAKLLRQGVVKTPAEIDVAMIHGFGFPRWRGGPMMASDQLGLIPLRTQLRVLAEGDAEYWQPEPLFDELIKQAQGFDSLN